MLKKYPESIAQTDELKTGPSSETLIMLLNYSKSLEVKKLKQAKILVHLN